MTEPIPEIDDDDLLELEPVAAPSRSLLVLPKEPVELVVRVKTEGMRLDQYLQVFFKDRSRSEIQDGIKAGNVTVNDKSTKASYKVRNYDKLLVRLPEPRPLELVPEDIPLEILYEDEYLAMVNKPWNMVVHPAKGNWSGTLVNALQFHFREALSNLNGSHRPGIVHRLDKDTSGVLLVGKEERTHRDLAMMFEARQMFKEYIMIGSGELDRDSDYVEGALKLNPRDRVRMQISTDPDAKHALSYYEVAERFRGYCLVKVQPKTGRTHQIRVHLAHVGCPVLADKLYGGRNAFRLSDVLPRVYETPDDELLLQRQALHAFRLRFKHPRTGKWLEVEAPLPSDIRRTLDVLRAHRAR